MLCLRKDAFPSSTQLSVFGRAYLVERFTKVASHMEAVEAYLLFRALNGLLYCRDEWLSSRYVIPERPAGSNKDAYPSRNRACGFPAHGSSMIFTSKARSVIQVAAYPRFR